MARLPYGRDKVAMYVFLPRENMSLDSVMENLTSSELEEAFNDTRSKRREVRVKLPKFKTKFGKRLDKNLKSLGLNMPFVRGSANFTGISDKGLYVSRVRLKIFIEFDEKGIEAAAATSAGMTQVSAPIVRNFIVGRPFLFFIRDDRSETNLFVGKIVNPNN